MTRIAHMDLAAMSTGRDRVYPVALFVDGALREQVGDRVVDVVNPSTGRLLFAIPAGEERDADLAVLAARRAFDDGRWSNAPPSVRKKTLHAMAELIAANAAQLDALDAGEMGKPVSEVLFNARAAAGLMQFYAEAVDKVAGEVFTSESNSFVTQRRIPRGVVAAVVPWNFPTFNAILKLAPALAGGNCVVLKPSELASRSAIRLAHLAIEAGLPLGVLNVVPGLGETVGRALGLHPQVDMIAFTGSTEVGKQMLQYAGQSNMKTVLAECGGKSPHIVFADGVDLDASSDAIAHRLVTNQGQICSLGSRLLVERSIEATVVERIAARLQKVVMGDALDPATTFGPVASSRQCARIMDFIAGAQAEGAWVAAGGRRALQESGGYFIEPTILRGVVSSACVAREEIFGPVLAVLPFDTEEEAIRIANDTMYGLAAYVWTANLSTGLRMAKALCSSVRINAAAPRGEGSGFAASSEPFRHSGVGVEGGLAGLESYLRRQLVSIHHG